MATKKQIEEFISKIAPLAVKAYKHLGKVKPSVCIGMACIESAYGTAGSCKYNSFFGQKVGTGKTARKYWDGTFFNSKTKEEYSIGKHTVITSAFRSYKSMEQCVFNFYELLNCNLYAGVKANANFCEQMKQIKQCGYMTSSTEVNSVLSIIRFYDLTKYDYEAINSGNAFTGKYIKGMTYTLQANMYVRDTPNGECIKSATKDAQNHMDIFPILKKGTKITCRDIQLDAKGNTWVKCPSGWICGMSFSGRIYIS